MSWPVARTTDVRGVRHGRFTVTRLHRTGTEPHRLLLIGSRSLLSPVRRSAPEAFGTQIADRVWLRTQRGIDLDMLWELRPVLAAINTGLTSWRLWRYDAVIVVYAARPAGLVSRWRLRGAGRLLQRVIAEMSSASHVLIVAFDDDDDASAVRRRQGRHVVTESHDTEEHITRLSTSADPVAGADAVAQRLLAPLAAADRLHHTSQPRRPRQPPAEPDDESQRQTAVDQLTQLDERTRRALQYVVDSARDAFQSTAAAIRIIDHDRQWTLAASGRQRETAACTPSLCDRAIRLPAPVVIPDIWSDPNLHGDPVIAAVAPIRFYAAHPVESVDGYRIGVLCVWDEVPHLLEEVDTSALRDLALLAEAEIITGTHR